MSIKYNASKNRLSPPFSGAMLHNKGNKQDSG